MIGQFLTEALVINVIALALAVTIIQIVRSPVSILFNIQIANFSSLSFFSVVILGSIIVIGILLSGMYPAIISMSYQPRVLFNLGSGIAGKRLIPSLLTIGQLGVAIVFIVLAFTVSFQINHILNMDTGVNVDQAITIEAPVVKPNDYETQLASLKEEISTIANVSSITSSTFLVNQVGAGDFSVKRIGSDAYLGMDANSIDEDFIPFYNLKMLAGRNFMKDDKPDGVIISRFAATRLGFNSPEEAIGTKIMVGSASSAQWQDAEVIGVFENFRNSSFFNMSQSSTQANAEGSGIVFMHMSQSFNKNFFIHDKVSVRVQLQTLEETISVIQTKFQQRFPGMVFTWYFLDQKINEVYSNEKIARNQIVLFTALALIIGCLGMLGTITNKVFEKTKEIGIRKVLGARLHQIANVLLTTTVKQIVVATVVGIPIGYHLTQLYLEKYSERIALEWWHFAMPILILVVIMFSTVASVLWKAARTNPVDALKYE